jgi:hypothetical protein
MYTLSEQSVTLDDVYKRKLCRSQKLEKCKINFDITYLVTLNF